MTTKEYIDMSEENLLHTYNRFQIVLEKGEDVYLYDNDGKKYLDFAAGIAVYAFGYGNKKYNDAIKSQIDKIIHTSNLFYNEPASVAAKRLTDITGMDRVFFTNSGTEAIEGAVKTARRYAYDKDGTTDHEIIKCGFDKVIFLRNDYVVFTYMNDYLVKFKDCNIDLLELPKTVMNVPLLKFKLISL